MPLGAENETRTRDPDLGKVVLYQLSYFRNMSLSVLVERDCKDTAKIRICKYFFDFLDFSTTPAASLEMTDPLRYPIYFAMSRTRRSLRGSTWNWPTEASMWSPPTPLSSVRKT